MTKEEIQPGAWVAIPAARGEDDSASYLRAVYYLCGLLANHGYPHHYLIVGEPFTTPDNVRLYMAPPFPQFCVESFNLMDLEPAPDSPTPPPALPMGGAPTLV